MKIKRASKFRIYPNKEQQVVIDKNLDCCRYVYNTMLDRNIKAYKRRGEHLSYNKMQNLLPVMKTYKPWLRETDSQALKYACRQIDDAYKKFFKKTGGFPKFKRKKDKQSYTTTNPLGIKTDDKARKVTIPKVGSIKTRGLHIPDNAVIKRATVSRETDGKYYISINYEYELTVVGNGGNAYIGLDFREGDLYSDSNGESAGKPNHLSDSLKRLKKAQNKLSRLIENNIKGYKTIGEKKYPIWIKPLRECRNIIKQRRKVVKIHRHIAEQRLDFLHKQSAVIAKRYNVICLENLEMQDMLLEKGDNPSAISRHNINRKIYDDGWYMFTKMLEYKAKQNGNKVVRIDKYFKSSQTCSCCGHVSPETKDLTLKRWTCLNCKAEHDRDINAAINIRNEGLRILGITTA